MRKALTIVATTVLLAACEWSDRTPKPLDTIITDVESDTTENSVTLLFAGDLMQHDGQIKAAYTSNGYDYTDVFFRISPVINSADVAIANFEVTLGGPPYQGYPQFSAPDEYLQASINAGFDVLVTANNHCCDTYARGLRRTLDLMDHAHIPHLGTYRDTNERDSLYPYLLEAGGVRIVLLNFTYGTNGIRVPSPYVVNLQDTAQIALDLAKAKAMNPDAIIAIPHWGIEYDQLPSAAQTEMADWLIAHGTDHVVGGHPHVVQPVEVRQDAQGKRHVVAYSLGNFVSNMTRPNTDGGMTLTLTLTKRGDETELSDASYQLFWVSRPRLSGKKNFRIYPASYPIDSLTAAELQTRDRFLNATRRLFNEHNKGIRENP